MPLRTSSQTSTEPSRRARGAHASRPGAHDTSSRRSGRRVATHRGEGRRLEPNTLPHFRAWCRRLKLDNGKPFELEPFQLSILADYFDGCRETLVLLPSGNGKTTLFAALAIYHLVYTPDAECYIAAASRDQAGLMYKHAKRFVEQSRGLRKRVKVLKGTRKIESRTDDGFIQVLASDENTADGVGPTLALVDELHRHKDDGLYVVLLKGLKKRRGQLITCTTAGDDEDTPLGKLRKRGHRCPGLKRRGKYTRGRSKRGTFAFHEFALDPKDDREDMRIVKQANPLSTITLEDLLDEHDSMPAFEWARFACGVWIGLEAAAVDPLTWASRGRASQTIPVGEPISLGLDLGWRVDSTAIVPLWMKAPSDRRFGRPTILKPPRDGSVQEDDILEAIDEFAKQWKVERIVFDPNAGGRGLGQKLEALGYTVVEYSQDPAPMALAASRFDEALREALFTHPEDPEFTAHVLSAVVERTSGEKWRYGKSKRKTRGKRKAGRLNDALIAAVIVHAVEVAELEEEDIDPADYRMEFA